MDNLTERDRQAQELSGEIITLARNSILVNLRFMDRAVGNFRCVPNMNYGFASGGGFVMYSPWTLILTYRQEQNLIPRNLLHSILHSVFRHSIVGPGIERSKWDLACDIAVEDSINGLERDFLKVTAAPLIRPSRVKLISVSSGMIYQGGCRRNLNCSAMTAVPSRRISGTSTA